MTRFSDAIAFASSGDIRSPDGDLSKYLDRKEQPMKTMEMLGTAKEALPPCNIDAESSVLSVCLLTDEGAKKMSALLVPEDFFRVSHQHIFRAVQTLVGRGRPVDHITVAESLEKQGMLDAVGGRSALLSLADNTFAIVNCEYHAGIVARTSMQRRLIEAATKIACMASAPQDDVCEVREEALRLVREAVSDRRV